MKKMFLEAVSIVERLINDVTFMCRSRKKATYFTRKNCTMGFRDLILFQINFTKKSLQLELDAFLNNTNGGGSITKQAYSEARRKILPTAFIEMSDGIIDWYYNDHDDFKKFRDYRLSAIDGSITQLPDTARLRDAYGYAEGNGAPMARAKVAALYDLENDLILSSVIDNYKTGERDLAKRLINDLRKKGLKNDLILFDRGYCGAWFYWYLEHSEVKYLMRAKEDTQIKAAQKPDQIINFTVRGKKKIKMRIVRFLLDSGEEEVLVTNLLDEDLSLDDFKKLYFRRWGIETKFNELKNRLEIQNFSGETVTAIKQDFYASIFLSNMAALAKHDANEAITERNKDKDLKYEYKVNTNILVGKLKDRLILMLLEPNPVKRTALYQKIMEEISANVVPIRPDRSYPRRKGARATKHPRNHKRAF